LDLSIQQFNSLADIDSQAWNRLAGRNNPFLRHEFLQGLEEYDCLSEHGWYPAHITAWSGKVLKGAVPLYFRTNSTGEFVFDWEWADAYERAGGQYYPKLVSAIPFTPVCGSRLLVDPEDNNRQYLQDLLIRSCIELAKKSRVSGLHILFPDDHDTECIADNGLMLRLGYQYHWFNDNYKNFEDFLAQLSSRRRKQIRKERREVAQSGVEIRILEGSDITPEHWQWFHGFYCSTFYRKWSEPRLTLPFFQSLSHAMPDAALLLLARYHDEPVAGAFAMRGKESLFGRHWGCSRHFRNLHFEMCYYQTIEYCIRHGLKRLDAGVQGEHKISRGFRPVPTRSAHWLAHPEFRSAVEDFLGRERQYIEIYIRQLTEHSAYRKAS